jgi:hypothetical protein
MREDTISAGGGQSWTPANFLTPTPGISPGVFLSGINSDHASPTEVFDHVAGETPFVYRKQAIHMVKLAQPSGGAQTRTTSQ